MKRRIHGHYIGGRTPTLKSYERMIQAGWEKGLVCIEWRLFRNFLKDMGERPEGTILCRKNPFIGYDVSNCIWATTDERTQIQRPFRPGRKPRERHPQPPLSGVDSPAYKHGGWKSYTYVSWREMRRRCSPSSRKDSKAYYDKGIRVCDRWQEYKNFVEDMGERPPGTTIDRIDNSKGYFPGNCRWATPEVQQSNRKCAKFNEERISLAMAWNIAGFPKKDVAMTFGCSLDYYCDIIKGRNWRGVWGRVVQELFFNKA